MRGGGHPPRRHGAGLAPDFTGLSGSSTLSWRASGEIWTSPDEGAPLGAILDALDARYPGFRFRVVDEQQRIRPHICFALREEFAHTLAHPWIPTTR